MELIQKTTAQDCDICGLLVDETKGKHASSENHCI
jgi:hypothetical protein